MNEYNMKDVTNIKIGKYMYRPEGIVFKINYISSGRHIGNRYEVDYTDVWFLEEEQAIRHCEALNKN